MKLKSDYVWLFMLSPFILIGFVGWILGWTLASIAEHIDSKNSS